MQNGSILIIIILPGMMDRCIDVDLIKAIWTTTVLATTKPRRSWHCVSANIRFAARIFIQVRNNTQFRHSRRRRHAA